MGSVEAIGLRTLLGILILTFVPVIRGQATTRVRPFALRADVRLILVPVTVMDRKGASVNGLEQNRFTVLDDRVSQKILSFSSSDVPCSVGLVLDLSGSMQGALPPAKEVLAKFLGTANPEDEFMLLGVGTKPVMYPAGSFENAGDFTSDTSIIQNMIHLAPLGGSTAFVDTVYAALGKMRAAQNPRRALVIVSDGMDNHSRHSKQELIRLAAEADVQMYTIAIDTVPREKKPIEQLEARRGLNYLEDLADRSGGIYFAARNRRDLSEAAERAGSAIRNQYVIGYRPQSLDSSGRWHRIQVKLDRDQVQVYARTGYYSR